jgi:hypothetical protein
MLNKAVILLLLTEVHIMALQSQSYYLVLLDTLLTAEDTAISTISSFLAHIFAKNKCQNNHKIIAIHIEISTW